MPKSIYPVVINTAVTASTCSWNTLKMRAGVLTHVYIVTNLSTTTFDFKLIDSNSIVAYDTSRREKTATYELDDEVHVPMAGGIYTLRIYNHSSSGETFKGRLMIEE